ncbi:helix-turn-helix domain-containing protein [Halovenus marina]|uniref:helix-turn-helix domain-containing protein n=1 Tax=Halovenus marina TaxID=3396621 RepID=UPI003F55CF05
MVGIRAELVFPDADNCPVADTSAEIDGAVTDVSRAATGNGEVVEQFTASDAGETMEAVFDYGAETVYEFERDGEPQCICEAIEDSVGPVTETYAHGGDLHVTLHTPDMDGLREVLGSLQSEFGDVQVEYLARGREERDESEVVPVDLRKLTERQREVVRTAYRMGYFEYPREANAGEVASELDIGTSTFTEHLNAAQSKLLDELLVRE